MNRVDCGNRERFMISRREAALVVPALFAPGCQRSKDSNNHSISFKRIPQANAAGSGLHDIVTGMASGVAPGHKVVLYAKTGKWWVQPLAEQPFTSLAPDSTWANATHLGSHYAALLVTEGYRPEVSLDKLPETDPNVLAVTVVPGADKPPSSIVEFGGYQWRLRDAPSGRGGRNNYSASNVEIDAKGAMHLRITKTDTDWSCAEVSLNRNLGYGTYEFVVRGLENLEPAAVFSMFTYDYASGAQHNREMDIEISRWGGPAESNAQYVMQPYYVAANVHRFSIPGGTLTFSLKWEPERASFRTARGSSVISEYAFTAGVPSPGIESIRAALYVFRKVADKMQRPVEVIIERFTYFP
jgi:hypothetical protein